MAGGGGYVLGVGNSSSLFFKGTFGEPPFFSLSEKKNPMGYDICPGFVT